MDASAYQPLQALVIDDGDKDDEPKDMYAGWKDAVEPPPEVNLNSAIYEPKSMDPVSRKVLRLIIQKLWHKPCVGVFVAKKNYGKTLLAVQLCLRALISNTVDGIIWFSNTAFSSSSMNWLPDDCKVQGFNQDILREIIEYKTFLAGEAVERGANSDDLQDMRRHGVGHDIIVLDDVMGDKGIMNNPLMKRLLSQHRHPCLTVFILNQSASHVVTPDVKQNADWFMVGRNTFLENTKLRTALNFDGSEFAFNEFISNNTRKQGLMLAFNSFTVKRDFDQQWALIRGANIDLRKIKVEMGGTDFLDFMSPPSSSDEEDEEDSETDSDSSDEEGGGREQRALLNPSMTDPGPEPRVLRHHHGFVFPQSFSGVRGVRPPWAIHGGTPYVDLNRMLMREPPYAASAPSLDTFRSLLRRRRGGEPPPYSQN